MDVVDRLPDPEHTDVRLPKIYNPRSAAEVMESSQDLQTFATLQSLSLISSDSRLTTKQSNIAKQVEDNLFQQVKTLTEKIFGRLKDRIANRRLYVLFEESLNCNTRTDHLIPKNTLPIFEEYIDNATADIYSNVYSLVHFATKALFDASQKQDPPSRTRIDELEGHVFQLRLQLEQIQQDYAAATDRFSVEQANAASELTRLREQLWQKNKYVIEYEADFNPYITPSKWGTLGLLTGGSSGIEDRKAVLTRLLDEERSKCAELRNRIAQLEIQVYAKSQQVDLLPSLYGEINALKQKLAEYDELLQSNKASMDMEVSLFQAKEEALKEELARLHSRLSHSSEAARSSQAAVAELTRRLSEKNMSLPGSGSSQYRGHTPYSNMPLDGIDRGRDTDESESKTGSVTPHSLQMKTPGTQRQQSPEGISMNMESDNLSVSSINGSSNSQVSGRGKSSGRTKKKRHGSIMSKQQINSRGEKRSDASRTKDGVKPSVKEGTKEKTSTGGSNKQHAKHQSKHGDVDASRGGKRVSEPVPELSAGPDDPSLLVSNQSRTDLDALNKHLEDLNRQNALLRSKNSELQNAYAKLEASVADLQEQVHTANKQLQSQQTDLGGMQTCSESSESGAQGKDGQRQDKTGDMKNLKQNLKRHLKKQQAHKRITAYILTKERFEEFKEEIDNDDTLISKVDYRPLSNTSVTVDGVYEIIETVKTQPSVLAHGHFLRSIDYRILEHTVNCVEDLVGKKFREEVSVDGACSEYMWFSESCSDSRCNDFDDMDTDINQQYSHYKRRAEKKGKLKDTSSRHSPLATSINQLDNKRNEFPSNIPDSLLPAPKRARSKQSEEGEDIGAEQKDGDTAAGSDNNSMKLRLYTEYVDINPAELPNEDLLVLLDMDPARKQKIKTIIHRLLLTDMDLTASALDGSLPPDLLLPWDDQDSMHISENRLDNCENGVDLDETPDSELSDNGKHSKQSGGGSRTGSFSRTATVSQTEMRNSNGSTDNVSSHGNTKIYQTGMLQVTASATETVRDIMPRHNIYISATPTTDKSRAYSRHRGNVNAVSQDGMTVSQRTRMTGSRRPNVIRNIHADVLLACIETLLKHKGAQLTEACVRGSDGTEMAPITGSTTVEITELGSIYLDDYHVGNVKDHLDSEDVATCYNTLRVMNIVNAQGATDETTTDLTTSKLDGKVAEKRSVIALKDLWSHNIVQIVTDSGTSQPTEIEVKQRGVFDSMHIKSPSVYNAEDADLNRLIHNMRIKSKVNPIHSVKDVQNLLRALGFDPGTFIIRPTVRANRQARAQSSATDHTANSNAAQIADNLRALSKEDKLALFLDAVLVKQITWEDMLSVFSTVSPVLSHITHLREEVQGSDTEHPMNKQIEGSYYVDEVAKIVVASQVASRAANKASMKAKEPTTTAESPEIIEGSPILRQLSPEQRDIISSIASKLQKKHQDRADNESPDAVSCASPAEQQLKPDDQVLSKMMAKLADINEDAIVNILLKHMYERQESEQSSDELIGLSNFSGGATYEEVGIDAVQESEYDAHKIFSEAEWQELEKNIPQDTLRFIKDKLALQVSMEEELHALKEQLYILQQAEQAARLSYEAPLEDMKVTSSIKDQDHAICSTCGQEISKSMQMARAPSQCASSAGRLPSQSGLTEDGIQLDLLVADDFEQDSPKGNYSNNASEANLEIVGEPIDLYQQVPGSKPVTAPDSANAAVTTLVVGNCTSYAEKLPIMGFVGRKVNQKYKHHQLVRDKPAVEDLQIKLGLLSIPQRQVSYPINHQYNRMGVPYAFITRIPNIDYSSRQSPINITSGLDYLPRTLNKVKVAEAFMQKQLNLPREVYNSDQHKIRAQRASEAVQDVIKSYGRQHALYHKLNWSLDADPRTVFIRLYENARELREKYEQRFQAKLYLEAELFNRYKQSHTYVAHTALAPIEYRDLMSADPMKESIAFVHDINTTPNTPQATYLGNDSIHQDKLSAIAQDSYRTTEHNPQLDRRPKNADVPLLSTIPGYIAPDLPIISPRLLLSSGQDTSLEKGDPGALPYLPEFERYHRQGHVSSSTHEHGTMVKHLITSGKSRHQSHSVQDSKSRSTFLLSGLYDSVGPHDDVSQLQISGVHIGSRSVHSYDNNTSGKLSIQARIHSQIDDLKLDELTKHNVSLNDSGVGNNSTLSGSLRLSKTNSHSVSMNKPLKPLQAITRENEEPGNIKVVNVTDVGLGLEQATQKQSQIRNSGALRTPEVFGVSTRSGSVRKSAAQVFKEIDMRVEGRLSTS